MEKDYLKYFKPQVLLGLIVTTAFGIYFLNTHTSIAIPLLGGVSIILTIVAAKLWNKKLFNWMFWVDDISGKYLGTLKYRFVLDGKLVEGELEHVKVINQNGHRISVTSFTKRKDGSYSSTSQNNGVYVDKTKDENHFQLIYNYLNEGSTEQGFPTHFGTEIIKIIGKGNKKKVIGRYFTEREPQTKGEINLKWVSDNLEHEF